MAARTLFPVFGKTELEHGDWYVGVFTFECKAAPVTEGVSTGQEGWVDRDTDAAVRKPDINATVIKYRRDAREHLNGDLCALSMHA